MKTTAIQVVPVIESTAYNAVSGEYEATIEAQPEGPTEHTTGWAVYERKEDGTVEWFADTGSELRAMWIGTRLAEYGDVEIEAQPWKVEETEEDEPTYKIFRHRFKGENSTIKTGLTLAEAQEHCSDPESSSTTTANPEEPGDWFDGYMKE